MHRLKPGVKINVTYYRDIVLRQMVLSDIRGNFVQHLEVSFSAGQCPHQSRERHSSAAGSRDARYHPTRSLAA